MIGRGRGADGSLVMGARVSVWAPGGHPPLLCSCSEGTDVYTCCHLDAGPWPGSLFAKLNAYLACPEMTPGAMSGGHYEKALCPDKRLHFPILTHSIKIFVIAGSQPATVPFGCQPARPRSPPLPPPSFGWLLGTPRPWSLSVRRKSNQKKPSILSCPGTETGHGLTACRSQTDIGPQRARGNPKR